MCVPFLVDFSMILNFLECKRYVCTEDTNVITPLSIHVTSLNFIKRTTCMVPIMHLHTYPTQSWHKHGLDLQWCT